MTKKKKSEAIAIVCYTPEGHDLYSKELYTEEEIQSVRDGEDENVESWKSIIILKKGFVSENHT